MLQMGFMALQILKTGYEVGVTVKVAQRSCLTGRDGDHGDKMSN